MSFLPGWFPGGAGAGAAKLELTYIGTVTGSFGDDATFTANDVDIGTPSEDRLVIVGVSSSEIGDDSQVSQISIAGSAGTLHVSPSGDWHPTGIASRLVTTGTTATISFSLSDSEDGIAAVIHVWTLKNYTSATPHDSDGINTTDGSTTTSVTLDLPANGVAVFVYCRGNTESATWSSATDRYNNTVSETRHSAADKSSSSEIASHVETVTAPTDDHGRGMSGVSWA